MVDDPAGPLSHLRLQDFGQAIKGPNRSLPNAGCTHHEAYDVDDRDASTVVELCQYAANVVDPLPSRAKEQDSADLAPHVTLAVHEVGGPVRCNDRLPGPGMALDDEVDAGVASDQIMLVGLQCGEH